MNSSTWYQTSPNNLSLYEVKVTRESKSSVWVSKYGFEHKEKRHSHFAHYWPTLDEAVAQLEKQAEKQFSDAMEEMEEAREVLHAISARKLKARKRYSQELPPPEDQLSL